MTATFDSRTRRVSIVPKINRENPAPRANVTGVKNGSDFDARGNGCYQKGDSIEWWLKQISNDRPTQKKKTNILNKLTSEDCDKQVRMDIGDHEDTPLEVLLLLSQDEDPDVRFAMAENHNIDHRVLKLLMDDPNPYVAYRAEQTLIRNKGICYRSW